MDFSIWIIVFLCVALVLQSLLGRWRERRGHRRAVQRAARAGAGELAAETLLESHGYSVLDRQVRCLWWIHIDGEEEEVELRADLLVERLESVCDKPAGISVDYNEVDFEHQGAWSAQDVRDKGWETKDTWPRDGTTLYWQILFPAGTYETDSVLGVAVDASTVALFSDFIDEADGPFGRPSVEDVENSVLVHELGHLLGLVNLVYQSPIDHEDEDHPGHSNNEDSVMYWAIESTDVANFIFGSLPSDFDDADRSDLAGLADGTLSIRDQLWP